MSHSSLILCKLRYILKDSLNLSEITTFVELKGTEKEAVESSFQNTKERSRLFKKAKSLSEPVKDRQNSLSHMEATKINPRTHSTKGISKVYINKHVTK